MTLDLQGAWRAAATETSRSRALAEAVLSGDPANLALALVPFAGRPTCALAPRGRRLSVPGWSVTERRRGRRPSLYVFRPASGGAS